MDEQEHEPHRYADDFRAVLGTLREIPDPLERARSLGAVLDAWPGLHAEVRAARQDTVAELRRTMKLTEVAAALGMTQSRVSQIAHGVTRTSKH